MVFRTDLTAYSEAYPPLLVRIPPRIQLRSGPCIEAEALCRGEHEIIYAAYLESCRLNEGQAQVNLKEIVREGMLI